MTSEELHRVDRFRRGDPEAFQSLYEACSARILKYLAYLLRSRERAEEALQATWVLALTHRESLRRPEKFGAWMLRIAHREALRALGESRRHEASAGPEDERAASSPIHFAIRQEDEERVRRAMDELPGPYREILWLAVVEELAHEEIAEILQVPVGTSRSRLHYAMLRLKEAIKPEGGLPK